MPHSNLKLIYQVLRIQFTFSLESHPTTRLTYLWRPVEPVGWWGRPVWWNRSQWPDTPTGHRQTRAEPPGPRANSRRPCAWFDRCHTGWPTRTFSDKSPPAYCPSATSKRLACRSLCIPADRPGPGSLRCTWAARRNAEDQHSLKTGERGKTENQVLLGLTRLTEHN